MPRAPPGFSAGTFTRAGLISGATVIEVGRRALPDGIRVGVGSCRQCLRCAAGGTEQQPARRAADDGCNAVLADGRFPHAHAVGDEPPRFRATLSRRRPVPGCRMPDGPGDFGAGTGPECGGRHPAAPG